MKILAIDLGSNTGVVLWDTEKQKVNFNITVRPKTIEEFGDFINPILHKADIDVVVSAYPTRFYWTIVSHGKQMGVLEYFASKRNVQVVYTNDSAAKKLVLGTGKAGKGEIMVKLSMLADLDDEHQWDCLMFAKWFELAPKD